LLLLAISFATFSSSQPAVAQFTQHAPKTVFSSAIGPAQQGYSVALSGDGTGWLVGGPGDNNRFGAAWVTPPSAGTKLIGGNNSGLPSQGSAVALSADGKTAIVGGPADNFPAGPGAAWIFARNGGTWTPQAKLVGSGGGGYQGYAVALSADGNTAIVGERGEGIVGGAFIFVRNGNTWTQQGPKLVGTAAIGVANQGAAVALSGDGNTAVLTGISDNNDIGATWVFTRNAGQWTQEAKLVGIGVSGSYALQGSSVAISADGTTIIVGATGDASFVGAAWVFGRSNGQWFQQGNKLEASDSFGASCFGTSVALSVFSGACSMRSRVPIALSYGFQ
jgi:hypothetical protein